MSSSKLANVFQPQEGAMNTNILITTPEDLSKGKYFSVASY